MSHTRGFVGNGDEDINSMIAKAGLPTGDSPPSPETDAEEDSSQRACGEMWPMMGNTRADFQNCQCRCRGLQPDGRCADYTRENRKV